MCFVQEFKPDAEVGDNTWRDAKSEPRFWTISSIGSFVVGCLAFLTFHFKLHLLFVLFDQVLAELLGPLGVEKGKGYTFATMNHLPQETLQVAERDICSLGLEPFANFARPTCVFIEGKPNQQSPRIDQPTKDTHFLRWGSFRLHLIRGEDVVPLNWFVWCRRADEHVENQWDYSGCPTEVCLAV